MTLDEFRKAYCARRKPEPKPGGKIYRGTVYYQSHYGQDAFDVWHNLPDGFAEVKEWSDSYYRVVWTNEDQRAIITYCEGDVYIEVYDDLDAYRKAFEVCEESYAAMS